MTAAFFSLEVASIKVGELGSGAQSSGGDNERQRVFYDENDTRLGFNPP